MINSMARNITISDSTDTMWGKQQEKDSKLMDVDNFFT